MRPPSRMKSGDCQRRCGFAVDREENPIGKRRRKLSHLAGRLQWPPAEYGRVPSGHEPFGVHVLDQRGIVVDFVSIGSVEDGSWSQEIAQHLLPESFRQV